MSVEIPEIPDDLAGVVDEGELDREEGPLLPADDDRLLRLVGAAGIEDLAIALLDQPLRVGGHDLLVGEADQLVRLEAGDFVGDAVGEHVAALAVLDVDRDRRPVHQRLEALLEGLAVRLLGEFQIALAQRVHRRDQQLPRPERLDQVAMRADLEGPLGDLGIVHPGDQDDRGVGVVACDLLDQHQARLVRHLDVAEGEVEIPVFAQLAAGVLDAAGELAGVFLAKSALDQAQHLGAVVGREDASRNRLSCDPARPSAPHRSRSRTVRSSSPALNGFSMKAAASVLGEGAPAPAPRGCSRT